MADYKPNEMQQKAIDILQGQVMLLAGPGTGKTLITKLIVQAFKYFNKAIKKIKQQKIKIMKYIHMKYLMILFIRMKKSILKMMH